MIGVRFATLKDAEGIRSVHLGAFPTPMEADLVERLGRAGDAVLSLVADDGGEIVGHILFSRMRVEADGRTMDALGLAPVAVLPERQGEGIGSKLIEQGLRTAADFGAEIVFVVGEPSYYRRFGFRAEDAAWFASPYAGVYFQAKTLSGQFRAPTAGRAEYAPAFAEIA